MSEVMCSDCGAIVANWAVHVAWHDRIATSVMQAFGNVLATDRAQGTAAANAEVTV